MTDPRTMPVPPKLYAVYLDMIACPFERARMLFNWGHRGPWHRGFWK